MTAVIVPMLLVIFAGFGWMVWLKREGDRSWAEYQRQARRKSITVTLTIDTTEFNAALRRMREAAMEAAKAYDRLRRVSLSLPTTDPEETPDR